MSEQTYTLLHLAEVFGKDKPSIRRQIAKLNLKAINRESREYANQALEYDYEAYLELARSYGLTSTYTTDYEEIELTASDVIDLCLEKYPNFQVKEIELEQDSNTYIYEIEGFDGEKNYEIEIDPVSGKMLKIEEEISPKSYWEVSKAETDQVELIVERILTKAGENSKLHEWSLENEEGQSTLIVEVTVENKDDKMEYAYNFATEQLSPE